MLESLNKISQNMKRLLLSLLVFSTCISPVWCQVKGPSNIIWTGETTFFYSINDADGMTYTIDTKGYTTTGGASVIKASPTLPYYGTSFITDNLRTIVEKHAGSLFSYPDGKTLSVEQALATFYNSDTVIVRNPSTGENTLKIIATDVIEQVAGYFIKQEWQIDATGRLYSRIKAIIPTLSMDETTGVYSKPNTGPWKNGFWRKMFEIRFDNAFQLELPFNDPNTVFMELRSSKVSFNGAIKNPARDSSAFTSLFPGTESNRLYSFGPLSILCDACIEKYSDDKLQSKNPFRSQSRDTVFTMDNQMKVIQHDYNSAFHDWKFHLVQAFFIDEKTFSLNAMVLGVGPSHEILDSKGVLQHLKTDYLIRQVGRGISK